MNAKIKIMFSGPVASGKTTLRHFISKYLEKFPDLFKITNSGVTESHEYLVVERIKNGRPKNELKGEEKENGK